MPSPEIEEFAKTLVQQVRDAAIRSSGARVRGSHRIAERWREAGATEEIVRTVAPDIVDDTIFHILRAIDQEMLRLSFAAVSGKKVELAVEGAGELGGWYMGSDGWRAKYSRERFADDFSDSK
jgi:hypothetical protein